MGPRKGLSFDEKRERLLQLFTETADFFTLKELEKIAPKQKGIVSQSVKEVLQSLVDDSMVNTDKCGVQTVFWALPSEASQKKKAKLAQLKEELSAANDEETHLTHEITQLQVGREDSEERQQVLNKLRTIQQQVQNISAQLDKFAEFDPEEVNKIKQNTEKSKESVNRWIDNIFNLQSWANKTFGMERRDFAAQFGVPDELDYVE